VLYKNTVHLLMLINIPYFVFAVPLLDIISYLCLYFIIKRFYLKMEDAASDIGYFLMIIMNFTFVYQLIFVILWFADSRDHSCGPIKSGYFGWYPI
jgi:hypothetical protein